MKLNLLEDVVDTKVKHNCKGLFWRGTVNKFISSHGSIELRKSLRPLKRLSCTGCEHCEWIMEYFREDVEELVDIDSIEHGKLYSYEVDSSKGYYDLYEEIDNINFVEVKPIKKGE